MWGKSTATDDGYTAPPISVTITAGKGLGKSVVGKLQYANAKIPFIIDSESFSKNIINYSFDVIYDPSKVGTVDSFNGLAKPSKGTPSVADGSKEKVTVSFKGASTGDYTTSNGALFKLNFVAKQDFTSGKTTAITDEVKKIAADVNGDGSITADDAKEISNYISGKASTLKSLFGYDIDMQKVTKGVNNMIKINTKIITTINKLFIFLKGGWIKRAVYSFTVILVVTAVNCSCVLAAAPVNQNFDAVPIQESARQNNPSLTLDGVVYSTDSTNDALRVDTIDNITGSLPTLGTGNALASNWYGTNTGTYLQFTSVNNSDNFKMVSLRSEVWGGGSGTAEKYTISGYDNGVPKVSATVTFTASGTYGSGNSAIVYNRQTTTTEEAISGNTANAGLLTFGSDWNNIDQVRFTVADNKILAVSVDQINFLEPTVAASIGTNPNNATVNAGSNASFMAEATGTGVTYQWQVDKGSGFTNISNGGAYSGATTATLNITGATADMNGYAYRLVVTGNAASVATSSSATLTVKAPQSITVTTGKGLGRADKKSEYANIKIPFTIDSPSFVQRLTAYSFDIIYDPTKVGTVTVDSFNGLAKPTIGTPVTIGSKEKVTVSWNGTFTGDLTTLYNNSKGVLFKLNFVAKTAFTSGDGETPIEIGTGSFTFSSGGSSSNITGTNGKIIFGIYGDVNGDGAITSSDTNLINKYVSGKTAAITGEAKLTAADVNGDGSITAEDAKEISNYISGKASTLKSLFGY
jgi:hypothetical protein